MYGEMSVIAGIPAALEGRAGKWFKAHGMPRDRMRSIDGWIEALTREFKVNTAIAREKARMRRYQPSRDQTVDDYYYDKLDLVRAAEAGISDRRTVEELWMGLPADFQALLDYDDFTRKPVTEVGHILRTKDLSYRGMRNRREDSGKDRERQRDGRDGRRRRQDDRRRERESSERKEGRHEDAPATRSTERKDRKESSRRGDDEKKLPPPLPKEKWRKDSEGRTMKRKCRHCDKWHMDFNCPTKPASYSISTTHGQWHHSSDESDADRSKSDDSTSDATTSSGSEDDTPATNWKSGRNIQPAYHNVYSHSTSPEKNEKSDDNIRIPRASQYRVEELSVAFSIGTGVSYLSAQPCPVKPWVGVSPSANRPLQTGVVDSGGPSIIDRRLVPSTYTILESPLKPVFAGIGAGRTPASGYVVLPVHLPNGAALSGDDRSARVAKMWVEFQVVE